LTNYTMRAGVATCSLGLPIITSLSLNSLTHFIVRSETEKRPADVLATIMGMMVKNME